MLCYSPPYKVFKTVGNFFKWMWSLQTHKEENTISKFTFVVDSSDCLFLLPSCCSDKGNGPNCRPCMLVECCERYSLVSCSLNDNPILLRGSGLIGCVTVRWSGLAWEATLPCSCEIDKSPVCRRYGGLNCDALMLLKGSSMFVRDWSVRRGGRWFVVLLKVGLCWYLSSLPRRKVLSWGYWAILFSPSSVFILTGCCLSTSLFLFSFLSCSCSNCCFCRVIGPVIASGSREPWLLSESLSFYNKMETSYDQCRFSNQ